MDIKIKIQYACLLCPEVIESWIEAEIVGTGLRIKLKSPLPSNWGYMTFEGEDKTKPLCSRCKNSVNH